MVTTRSPLPFSAIIGQDTMKRALLLNALDPGIGGVLIRGQKGTAKSTTVRALADLLPDIEVVAGCRFNCDPDDALRRCDECVARLAVGETLARLTRRMRVIELPINASEDRVVGSIDIEAAIKKGEKRFEPGVLAEANRNILYVDEVNLLDDHLIDVLLDAAAMGRNTVEREGVSVSHPSRFILVGTMNPEEGELRPQLLDRFGLCVDVEGLRSVSERVNVMEQEARGRGDLPALLAATDAEQTRLRQVTAAAQDLLSLVSTAPEMRVLVSTICVDAGALGHRADLVLARTAHAISAWREAEAVVANTAGGALAVGIEDVVAAAELALRHRRRDQPAPGSSESPSLADRARQQFDEIQRDAASAPAAAADVGGAESSAADAATESAPASASDSGAGSGEQAETNAADAVRGGDIFNVRKIQLPRDRKSRTHSGKRSQSRSGDRRGRYVAATQAERTTDLAFDATLRAAAPHQARRRAETTETATAFFVERQDLRQKVRRRKTGTLIVFVVDASASMDAEQRMEATKGAILSLLRDAYVRRDKVALVVFSGRSARIVLQPTSSIDLAESRLQRLGVGGTTPLTHGLLAGLKLVRGERLRDATVIPLMVVISDGRGNISLFGEEPMREAQRVAEQIGTDNIRMLIIDSARDYSHPMLPRIPGAAASMFGGGYAFNACQDLADRSGGEYLGLYDLSQGAILAGVQRTLRSKI